MKVKLTIPTELKDIKLSQYQKFIKTTKDSEDDNFIARQMVAIFCDIPDDLVDSVIKAKEYETIVKSIKKVLEDKPTFIQRFYMDGVEYGFIPDLNDISVAEKADIDDSLQDIKDFNKAMGVLYRPIVYKHKDTYLIKEYREESNIIKLQIQKELATSNNQNKLNALRKSLLEAKAREKEEYDLDVTLDVAFGANVFFLTLMNDLLKCTLNFIEDQAVHNQKVSQLLEKNGIGIVQSMHSLKGMFNNLTTLVN